VAAKSTGRPTAGYKNAAGEKVPGVTTIIGRFKDSGALLHWAFGQGKLAEQGKINNLYEKRDEAAEAGTLAHTLIETAIHGGDPVAVCTAHPIAETREKAWNAYQQYQKWASQTGIEILATEIPLVSEKYQFGGTPDAIGKIGNDVVLVDWKTSNGVYVDYLIQLAAYKELIEECTEYRITGGFHLLRFSKESADFAHHHWGELDDAWRSFILFRDAYELDKKLKKRAA
jgi:hypothetical protein